MEWKCSKKVWNRRECFKALHRCNIVKNWARYQKFRNETWKVVSDKQSKAFEDFYSDLGTKNEECKTYKLAKNKERKSKHLDQVWCIKDEGK